MTISEMRDYLAKYTGDGKGDAPILVCDKRDNPLTDGICIADAVFIECKDGGYMVVIQTG
jgi:hypothetical protein